MGAVSLERLIQRLAPDRSIRSLCEDAGMPHNTLAYWLRPSTSVNRMPTMSQMRDIAVCIPGADVIDVSRAFADEIGLKLHDDLTDTERELLQAYRKLPEHDQDRFRRILLAFLDS